MSKLKQMGYFPFSNVDPDECRRLYGGKLTDEERTAVLAYMAAATVHATWKGLACSRIEGTWRWWTEADKQAAREAYQRTVDHCFPMQRAIFPAAILPVPPSVYENMADDPEVSKAIDEVLKDERDKKRPSVNGTYDAVTLGCRDMKTPDGKWVFPDQWDTHYVAKHGLSPDREFVADALRWWHRRKRNVWDFLEFLETEKIVLLQQYTCHKPDVLLVRQIKALVKKFIHEHTEEKS